MNRPMQNQTAISRIRQLTVPATMTLAAVLAAVVVVTPSAPAQSFNVLYSFTGTGGDGANPLAGLVRDTAGNLYGTTSSGGGTGCGGGGCGTVFKVKQNGQEKVLYSFLGSGGDGANPYASLIQDAAGTLYGTTYAGGASDSGTVFKVKKTGQEKVLYTFTGGNDGYGPTAGLVQDATGILYGTTHSGGVSGHGTVFKVTRPGQEKVLHSFPGDATDGSGVYSGLIQDAAGNLYGTTRSGGKANLGTVFKVTKTGREKVLYSFAGGADGENPISGLIEDAAGNLYGTTSYGGGTGCGGSGCGTVFKLSKTGKEKVLYSFAGGADGANPYASLIRDAAGNFYGTTGNGGSSGFGTVFKLTKAGTETVLHSFAGGAADGQSPNGLVSDATVSKLYGTTYSGGASGVGTVFQLTP